MCYTSVLLQKTHNVVTGSFTVTGAGRPKPRKAISALCSHIFKHIAANVIRWCQVGVLTCGSWCDLGSSCWGSCCSRLGSSCWGSCCGRLGSSCNCDSRSGSWCSTHSSGRSGIDALQLIATALQCAVTIRCRGWCSNHCSSWGSSHGSTWGSTLGGKRCSCMHSRNVSSVIHRRQALAVIHTATR